MSGFFQFGRTEGFPAIYSSHRTWVTIDIVELVIYFFFTTLAVIYLIIIPGYGKTKSIYTGIKVFFSLFIGYSIMIGNYGQEWEVGRVVSSIPYRAGEKNYIQNAEIGIKIGLRSVNVTLKGQGEKGTILEKEIINYNERFSWTWDQGIFGFGPNAGLLQRSLRDAQRKGLPQPIIWIVDYFAFDGEGLRFGRFYRTAGWYCHVLLWVAVPAWILANIYLQSIGRYAAYCTGLIGILEILACIIWINVRNPFPLIIPIENEVMRTFYGPTFWITLISGILCLILALILIILDLRYPNVLAIFLGIDILNQYDEFLIRAAELDRTINKDGKCDSIELGKMSQHLSKSDGAVMLLKRRTASRRAQKNRLRVSYVPLKIETCDDRSVYVNQYIPGPSYRDGVSDAVKPPIPKRK